MLCLVCSNSDESVEFPTVKDFIEHEKTGHVSRPVKPLPLPIKEVKPSLTEQRAGMKDKPAEGATPVPPTVPEKPVEVPPLRLEYKWIGRHKDCNTEVKTIQVDLGKKAMVIAYCINCDRKLEQEEVIPIKEQIAEETFEVKLKGKKTS